MSAAIALVFGMCVTCLRWTVGSGTGSLLCSRILSYASVTFDVVVGFWGTVCTVLFEVLLCGFL